MNTVARASLFGVVALVGGALTSGWIYVRSPYATNEGVPRQQPVPFSHAHHVGDVGIDCRYCHTTVETQATAGMPATSVCMNCHTYLFDDQQMLQPVRESLRSGEPIEWTRVHDVPDYTHFNHSIHVQKGVGCVSCHGRVDQMPLVWKENTLLMEWCLQCHRNPTAHLRPREFVFRMESLEELSTTQEFAEYLQSRHDELDPKNVNLTQLRQQLAVEYAVKSELNCSRCHY